MSSSTSARLLVALLAMLSASGVLADEIPKGGQAGDPLECTLSGEVRGLGHRITIPQGLVGCSGWHRVYMVPIVDLTQDRFVLVSYGPTSINEPRSGAVASERSAFTASGMPGERAVYRYPDSRGIPTVLEVVTLTSTLPSEILEESPLFQLSLSLVTTPEHHAEDRRVLESMVGSIEQDADAW